MSSSGSERGLRVWISAVLAAWLAGAAAFYAIQNQLRPVGGDIPFAKAAWLAYAVLFWFVLPALMARDSRLPPAWRRPFKFLLALMLARGLAELWMLYVSLNCDRRLVIGLGAAGSPIEALIRWCGMREGETVTLATGRYHRIVQP